MSRKNSQIEGFMVLLKLTGAKDAKKFITGTEKQIEFDEKNPLHRFVITLMTNKYRTVDVSKELLDTFGIKIRANSKEMKEICKKVIERAGRKHHFDPLEGDINQRRHNRERLFAVKAKEEIKKDGYKIMKTIREGKPTKIGKTKLCFHAFKLNKRSKVLVEIKNGAIEYREV